MGKGGWWRMLSFKMVVLIYFDFDEENYAIKVWVMTMFWDKPILRWCVLVFDGCRMIHYVVLVFWVSMVWPKRTASSVEHQRTHPVLPFPFSSPSWITQEKHRKTLGSCSQRRSMCVAYPGLLEGSFAFTLQKDELLQFGDFSDLAGSSAAFGTQITKASGS